MEFADFSKKKKKNDNILYCYVKLTEFLYLFLIFSFISLTVAGFFCINGSVNRGNVFMDATKLVKRYNSIVEKIYQWKEAKSKKRWCVSVGEEWVVGVWGKKDS